MTKYMTGPTDFYLTESHMHFEMFYYNSFSCKHELLINFFFHKLKLNCRGVRHYFHTKFAYCLCLISLSTAIYHFRRVPKMLPNKRFESGGGIFNVNTVIFRRHSGCLLLPLLLPLFFFSFSFRFWQASKGLMLAKAHYCPHRSQIEVWIADKCCETDF